MATQVEIDHMYAFTSPHYNFVEARTHRATTEAKCRKFMDMGYHVEYKDVDEGKRIFYIEFPSDDEAVIFKLTHL